MNVFYVDFEYVPFCLLLRKIGVRYHKEVMMYMIYIIEVLTCVLQAQQGVGTPCSMIVFRTVNAII